MKSFQIRQAVLADLVDIAPLFDSYRQFYGKESNLDAAQQFLRDRFNHGESTIFLAFDGAKPIGFTQLYPSFSSVSMARVSAGAAAAERDACRAVVPSAI